MSKIFEIQNLNPEQRSYYCSSKFKFLKIDLVSKNTYNCAAAVPHAIDFDWVEQHPGELFNIDINVNERQMMLKNQRNSSCEMNCWPAEDQGALSMRQVLGGVEVTHTDVRTSPEIIDLVSNIDCNLTCSYCCKEYSSAWKRDIVNNGDYVITGMPDNRYIADAKDRLLLKISQPELVGTKNYQTLIAEVKSVASTANRLVITGGEPLLNNYLIDNLQQINMHPDSSIEIYTGLGLSMSRFIKTLEKLKQLPNLVLIVSSETTDKLFEFNRYGAKWSEFTAKIELIKQQHINIKFNATISNLTMFGFGKFYQTFKDNQIVLTFAHNPMMMCPHVLDADSKKYLIQEFESLPQEVAQSLLKSMEKVPSEIERTAIRDFLIEFTARRKDLTLDVFPTTFLKWLKL